MEPLSRVMRYLACGYSAERVAEIMDWPVEAVRKLKSPWPTRREQMQIAEHVGAKMDHDHAHVGEVAAFTKSIDRTRN